MSESQSQATHFFANRVIQQATSDGNPLSDAECRMLYWSESDPSFKADPRLTAAFADQTTDEEFERKISGLLKRAFQADVAADPHARERWRRAFAVLQRGDHYVTVMIERALGSKMTMMGWRQIWGVRAVPSALVVSFVLLGYAFAVAALVGHTPSREEYLMVTWVVLMAIALVYGLARLAFGRDTVDGFVNRITDRVFGIRHQ